MQSVFFSSVGLVFSTNFFFFFFFPGAGYDCMCVCVCRAVHYIHDISHQREQQSVDVVSLAVETSLGSVFKKGVEKNIGEKKKSLVHFRGCDKLRFKMNLLRELK
jgi:hypothetical protein